MKHFFLCITTLLISASGLIAQQGSEVYGLNFIQGQLSLAGLNPSNGFVNVISPNPTSPDQFAAGVSDIDPVSERYFYVRQNQLYTVSLKTGLVTSSPPLTTTTAGSVVAPITNIAFNWLNDTIYGLQFTPGALSLAAVDPTNGRVQVLSSAPISQDRFSQGDADIDPVGRRYFYLREGNQLISADLNTGQATSQVRVNIPPNLGPGAFMNIAYNYMDGMIYGLIFKYGSPAPCTGTLYLAKADPSNGQLTVLSSAPTSNDCFSAGVCDIDPMTNRYFYTRGTQGGQQIIVVDTRNGNVLSRKIIGSANNTPVYITNIAFNELYNVAPNNIIPMQMGDGEGKVSMNGQSELTLNAFVGPEASYTWQDGSTSPTFTARAPGRYTVDIIRDGFSVKGEVEIVRSTSNDQSLNSNLLSLYPNPVTDQLSLRIDQASIIDYHTVLIQDISGKTLLSLDCQEAMRISTKALAPGLYFLSVLAEGHRTTRRFVKR